MDRVVTGSCPKCGWTKEIKFGEISGNQVVYCDSCGAWDFIEFGVKKGWLIDTEEERDVRIISFNGE